MGRDAAAPRLPPGQRAAANFPRFGTHLHLPPPPVPRTPSLRMDGAGSVPVTVTVEELDAKRTEMVADFHCVAGWSALALRWEGVPFAEFYREAVESTLPAGVRVTHFAFAALDGYRAFATAEDVLGDDVLLATRLNGQPLDPDHGAPLRLVSPSQYGYQSVKHLCAVELLTSEPQANFGSASRAGQALMRRPIFARHPRSRVWAEERNRVLPNWVARPLYRALTPPLRKLCALGSTSRARTTRHRRRRLHVLMWRLVNPPTRRLAGLVPWWVLIETRGNQTGRTRRTPVAAGPRDASGMWLNAVHGRHSGWVRNIDAEARVRVRVGRHWHSAVATVHPFDPALAASFNAYARRGPSAMGIDPLHVRLEWVTISPGQRGAAPQAARG